MKRSKEPPNKKRVLTPGRVLRRRLNKDSRELTQKNLRTLQSQFLSLFLSRIQPSLNITKSRRRRLLSARRNQYSLLLNKSLLQNRKRKRRFKLLPNSKIRRWLNRLRNLRRVWDSFVLSVLYAGTEAGACAFATRAREEPSSLALPASECPVDS